MSRMAGALDADLDAAELRGELPPELREEMVMSCTGCSDPGACQRWLSEHEHADRAPDYCRNGDLLRLLAAE
jgi:hypothetical protein